jgi:hypothetical protein
VIQSVDPEIKPQYYQKKNSCDHKALQVNFFILHQISIIISSTKYMIRTIAYILMTVLEMFPTEANG